MNTDATDDNPDVTAPPPGDPASPETRDEPSTTWGRAWTFVPTLYFTQGLPYVVANEMSVVLYKTLGIDNARLVFWTSWIGLVWAFKALWSPFVDGVSTKRRWTVATQLALVPVLVFLAFFALPLPFWFEATLVLFFGLAFVSATHDIAADGLYMVGLRADQQAAFVGVRSTAWRLALWFGQSVLIVAAGLLSSELGQVGAWQTVLAGSGVIFGVAALWHYFVLPVAETDVPRPREELWGNAWATVQTFFAKPGIGQAILFIGFFRFAENHMAKLIYPFLLDPVTDGGLGLSTEDAGFAKATVGVGALVLGGILGGLAIYRDGLRAWLWPMAVAINVPNLVYVYLAWAQPESYATICACIGLEHFGYGFGFTAYLMYLIQFAEGPYKTAHYAFATGLMALSVTFASFWSGEVQEQLGYLNFFAWVAVATLPGFGVVALVRGSVPPEFGRRTG